MNLGSENDVDIRRGDGSGGWGMIFAKTAGDGDKIDHVSICLDKLRDFLRNYMPNFEKLGAQKDRTRILGESYINLRRNMKIRN